MLCRRNSSAIAVIFAYYYFTILTMVSGCGQLPSGQGRNLRFSITGFTIPAAMAYTTEADVQSQVSSISRDEQEAKAFVQNLLMRSIEDVLEQEGRSAFLPDAVISAVLQQLTVKISYTKNRNRSLMLIKSTHQTTTSTIFVAVMMDKRENCYITNNIVTNICEGTQMQDCMNADIKEVPAQHRVISGSFTTTNVIMANWSTQMWQNILNRVMRSLSSGAFGANFIGATVMIA